MPIFLSFPWLTIWSVMSTNPIHSIYLSYVCRKIKQSFAGKFLGHSSRIPAKSKLKSHAVRAGPTTFWFFWKSLCLKLDQLALNAVGKFVVFKFLLPSSHRRGYFSLGSRSAHTHDCDRLLSKRGQILKLWVTSLFFSLMRSPFFPSPDPFRICLC